MRGMKSKGAANKGEKRVDLIDIILSWSLQDILNENLFIDKVVKMDSTFNCVEDYLKAFEFPLMEEVRADMSACLNMLSSQPFTTIHSVTYPKNPKYFTHKIEVPMGDRKDYIPHNGDVIVISDVRAKHIQDLTNNGKSLYLALVVKAEESRTNSMYCLIYASRRVEFGGVSRENPKKKLFYGIYLLNMVTYNRVWSCLDYKSSQMDHRLIEKVISGSSIGITNDVPLSEVSKNGRLDMKSYVASSDLNQSQTTAVLNCISEIKRQNRKPVSLIWGPPGTGKTKTTTSLLWIMQESGHKTLTCAPTNTAVKQVASRLLKLVKQNCSDGNLVLGDLLIFGNRNRLCLDNGLEEIFLDYRVGELLQCFSPRSGWKQHLSSMAELLQVCPSLYSAHKKTAQSLLKKKKTAQRGGIMGFTAFLRKSFNTIYIELDTCFRTLLLHVPRYCLSEADSSSIKGLLALLDEFKSIIYKKEVDGRIRDIFSPDQFKREALMDLIVLRIVQITKERHLDVNLISLLS